jgi:hypothetical protein
MALERVASRADWPPPLGLRTARLGVASYSRGDPAPSTKEARRVESAGFLRGYSRGALGAAIGCDPRRRELRIGGRRSLIGVACRHQPLAGGSSHAVDRRSDAVKDEDRTSCVMNYPEAAVHF